MSIEDGLYEYEQEIVMWLERRSEQYSFLELETQVEKGSGQIYEDTIFRMCHEFNFNVDQVKERLHSWREWQQYMWDIPCEQCGARLTFTRITSNIGCVCGAMYDNVGWRKYHRDDTMGGRVKTEIGKMGTVIKTISI